MYKRVSYYFQLFTGVVQQYLLYYYYRYFVFSTVVGNPAENPRVLFGPSPIINNKYWALALKSKGYKADSITTAIPVINTRQDFDLLIDELFPIKGICNTWNITKQRLQLFAYILKEYDIFVMAFRFNYFDDTFFSKKEAGLLHKYGKKVIIIPYGSDYYEYAKVLDPSLRHNLMINVPGETLNFQLIRSKVEYWVLYADFMIMTLMIDGAQRWDCLPVNVLCLDQDLWNNRNLEKHSQSIKNKVTIVHTPNHRGFKGTEFIVKAIEELKEEGLKIEFILLERMPNEKVREILTTKADILVEQIIFTGYALSAVEGMAAGLPVLSNFENKDVMNLFRRYSYLNECPIVSTSPENIKENLRLLITKQELRRQLGEAGRKYAEKYHSYHTFASMFAEIEKKIWRLDPSADLMNFFNPQNPASYNNQSERVSHPLHNSRIPV